MLGSIIGIAVVIVLCIIIYHQNKKEKALVEILEQFNDMMVELEDRVRNLETQDFS